MLASRMAAKPGAPLFTELRARDYKMVGTTKQNVMLELMPQIS